MSPNTTVADCSNGLYGGARVVLEQWFDAPSASPAHQDPIGRHLAACGYPPSTDQVYSSTAAFVADLVLRDIAHRLPGGAGCSNRQRNGALGRHDLTACAGTTIHFLPRLLFGLNWATHGEYIRWPADYYATWLPGYRRWIVTASSDTAELWGARNVALGWFEDAVPVRRGARAVLLKDWRGEFSTFSPFPWESVLTEGAIDRGTAGCWRAEAWPDHGV